MGEGEAELALKEALKAVARKEYDRALDLLERLLERDPSYAQARLWQRLARARRERDRGNAAGALQAYRSVLDLDPKHHEARKATGELGTSRRSSILDWMRR